MWSMKEYIFKRKCKSPVSQLRLLWGLCTNWHSTVSLDGLKRSKSETELLLAYLTNEVSHKLQFELELSLERPIQIAHQSKQIKQQNVSLCSDCAVDTMRQGRRQFHGKRSSNDRQWPKKQEHSESKHHPTCSHCNWQHGKMHPCPAKNKKCRRCNKIGHFEAACQTRKLKEVVATPLIQMRCFSLEKLLKLCQT